jgi:hypothetical protein
MNVYKFHTNPESLDYYDNFVIVSSNINELIDVLNNIDVEFQRGSDKSGEYKFANRKKLNTLVQKALALGGRLQDNELFTNALGGRLYNIDILRIYELLDEVHDYEDLRDACDHIQNTIDDLENTI